jgi:hypothetical protein
LEDERIEPLSQSIFETNLAALKQISPVVAQEVSSTTLAGLDVEIVQSKTPAPSVRITPAGQSKPILLHSAYDPLREAERWAQSLEFQEPINVVVMGFGLGYHLLTLLNLHDKNIRFLIIIEPDLRILRLALGTVDLRRLLARNGILLIPGAAAQEVPDIIGEVRTDFILHNFRILAHDPSVRCHPAYYAEVQKQILDAVTHDEVNLRTTFENQGRNQFNIYMNLPAIIRGYSLKDCANMLEGFPAVVAAAGPSLDQNVAQLHQIQDRAALFVVDTAQRTFLEQGIQPDLVVSADPTPLNFSHFEHIASLGESFLAFHPEVNRQITRKFITHPWLLPLFDRDSKLVEYLFDLDHVYGSVPRAMNVGHIAFNLARHFGCAPIILVGFDFAFPRYGGTTHARSAALSRSVSKMEADGRIDIGGKEGKAIDESGRMTLVAGYYGEDVPTTVPFRQYIHALEKTVAECGFEVIDATEGGAAFQGTTRIPLQEALNTRLGKTGVQQRWSAFKQKKISTSKEGVLQKLQQGKTVLMQGRKTCDRLLQYLKHWKRLAQQGQVDWQTAQSQWNEFDRIWVEMVGQPEFNHFLGTSVQYLYFCRQRQSRPVDPTAIAFLSSMIEKYSFIIPEMAGLLDNFIQTIDLAIMALNTPPENLQR